MPPTAACSEAAQGKAPGSGALLRRGPARATPRPHTLQQTCGRTIGRRGGVVLCAGAGGRLSWEERETKVLGQQDFILSQANGVEDSLYKGNILGADADITDGSLKFSEVRSLEHLDDDYYIPPRFLDAMALHVTKNFLVDAIHGRVPLILGIWGHKGCGKTFNVELSCKRLGLSPIIVSSGELEDEWAGEPGKKLRSRYRRAAQMIHQEGKPAVLVINDLDAGVGRHKNTTGYTVNHQLVQATVRSSAFNYNIQMQGGAKYLWFNDQESWLFQKHTRTLYSILRWRYSQLYYNTNRALLMNLCDRPNEVVTGEYWIDKKIPRVPIIITGNDLSRLYAPLIRDGRMDKFYWEPSREDYTQMLMKVFEPDTLSREDCEALLDTFPNQPLDFFGAIRSRSMDSVIRKWVHNVSLPQVGAALYDSLRGVCDPPTMEEYTTMNDLGTFVQAGLELAQEQEHVNNTSLSREYLRWQEEYVVPERVKQKVEVIRKQQMKLHTHQVNEKGRKMLEGLMAYNAPSLEEQEALEKREVEEATQAKKREEQARLAQGLWLMREALEAQNMVEKEGYVYVDLRSQREHNRECPKGSVNVPAMRASGVSLSTSFEPDPEFVQRFTAAFPDRSAKALLSSLSGDDYGKGALSSLAAEGYTGLVELVGGYEAWSKWFTPSGVKRQLKGKWGTPGSMEHDYWTASN